MSSTDESPDSTTQSKGRPTPSRAEARAAARERARVSTKAKAANRGQRAQQAAKVREAMKTGDDRYLPARDQGPVRRFVRDWVDVRFTVIELVLPVLILAMFFGYLGNRKLAVTGEAITVIVVIVSLFNVLLYRGALKREIEARFPQASFKGLTYYMAMRMFQMRFMRMPKPQTKVGQKLPPAPKR